MRGGAVCVFADFETGGTGGMLADFETRGQREADLRWVFALAFPMFGGLRIRELSGDFITYTFTYVCCFVILLYPYAFILTPLSLLLIIVIP